MRLQGPTPAAGAKDALHVQGPKKDWRTLDPLPVRLADLVVDRLHDLPRPLVGVSLQRGVQGVRGGLLQRQGRRRVRKAFPAELALDPPIRVGRLAKVGKRLACGGQIIELAPLLRIADLSVDPALVIDAWRSPLRHAHIVALDRPGKKPIYR